MNEAFGDHVATVERALAPRGPDAEVERVLAAVASLADGAAAVLDLAVPTATAAFSRRDMLRPGYPAAAEAAQALGFAPMTRPVGGHLAAYDEGSLVLHLWAPHPDPRSHIKARFELFGDVVTRALRGLGVDARLGRVPGEYCDGEYSVNTGGVVKLVGTGQRITRAGYLFSAVVMVERAEAARAALMAAYDHLGLELRPESVGCVADSVPGITVPEVREHLVTALAELLPLADPAVPATA
ncbi:hypothetical protein ACFP3Q_13305 [Nocardioides sp. GCM10027113]|uniref:lipoyl protein ligase domain-containing protein n=1 Tax=unclassified Nocardioides TaxID=2615069 RepID=UPI00361D7394